MACSTVLQVRTHLEGWAINVLLLSALKWALSFCWKETGERISIRWGDMEILAALQRNVPWMTILNVNNGSPADLARWTRDKAKLLIPQSYILIFFVLDLTVYMFYPLIIYIYKKICTCEKIYAMQWTFINYSDTSFSKEEIIICLVLVMFFDEMYWNIYYFWFM